MAVGGQQAARREPAIRGEHDPYRAGRRRPVRGQRPTGYREDHAAPRPDRGDRGPAGDHAGRVARAGGAFSGGPRKWTAPDGSRRVVAAPRRELTGFEIVVASSNNNAVENITRELPGLGAIGAGWQAEAQYFAELATAFLGEPAWGMVAAPLGNAEKRGEFRNRFWWGDGRMHALLQAWNGIPRRLRIGVRRRNGSARRWP